MIVHNFHPGQVSIIMDNNGELLNKCTWVLSPGAYS